MTNFEIADTDTDPKVFEIADTDADTDMKIFETADTDADTDMIFLKNRGHGHACPPISASNDELVRVRRINGFEILNLFSFCTV